MIGPLPATIARAAVTAAGISRLGDITGLDRLGVPVWQAVRPCSRSLSTHQGKAFQEEQARVGAVMEAIECDAAERWEGPRLQESWSKLDPKLRTASADDLSDVRGGLPADRIIDWTPAEPLGLGRSLMIPVEAVTLDCTRRTASGVGHSSSGQGAHFDCASATLKALYEVVERDAEAEFLNGSPHVFGLNRVAMPNILPPHAAELVGRCGELEIEIRLHAPPSLAGVTVIFCELIERRANGCPHAFVLGSGASLDPTEALLQALLEAAQGRVTCISGARDDLPLCPQPKRRLGLQQGPALRDKKVLPPSGAPLEPSQAIDLIVERLAHAGYRQVGRIVLPSPHADIDVVKCWVPGLGLNARRRRKAVRLS